MALRSLRRRHGLRACARVCGRGRRSAHEASVEASVKASVSHAPVAPRRVWPDAVLVALLLWQVVEAASAAVRRIGSASAAEWSFRLSASTLERMRRALGDDARAVVAVQSLARPEAVVLVEQVQAQGEDVAKAEVLQLLAARNLVIDRLTTLLYPEPWVAAVPRPIQVVEHLTAQGHVAELCVLPWQPRPAGRAGWELAGREAQVELWRYRTD